MLLGIALWLILVLASGAVIHVAVDRALNGRQEKKDQEALDRVERLEKERRDRVESFYDEYQASEDCKNKPVEELDKEISNYTKISVDEEGDFLAFDVGNSVEEIAQ